MKIYFSQLSEKLKKGLDQFYLISGDEPLQKMEAADMIRTTAKANGYQDRELFFVERDFDWGGFNINASNASLFSGKRFLDIRIQTEKITAKGVEFFRKVLNTPIEDCLFLIQVTKVDGRSDWVKKLSTEGVWLPVYPKHSKDITKWLLERAARMNLIVEDGVIELIAQYTEGNMLAAGQELQKIQTALGDSAKTVELEKAQKIMSDSANYTAFDLADAAIVGSAQRALRIYYGLLAQNTPLPLILWALADQFRKMADISQRLHQGESIDSVIRGIWRMKQPVYRQAINRQFESRRWRALLHSCYQVDLALKGNGLDSEWNELLRLIIRALGINPLKKPAKISANRRVA